MVGTAPTEVRLDFSDEILDLGGVVHVVDRDGSDWADGALVAGRSVIQKLRPGAPNGAYQVRWRAVSVDGHPVSGLVNYSVGEVAAEPITANPADGSPERVPAEDTQRAAASDTPAQLPPLALLTGFGVGGALTGLAVFLVISSAIRRRTTSK